MKVKAQLKDIVSYSKGSQINGDELLDDGKYDYLNGGVLPSGKWNEYNTEAETVTVSEGGNSCGFVNYMQKPFWCGAHCYYLYDSKVNTRYLYYILKSQQDRLMNIRSGACMPNIKKSDLGKFEVIYDTDSDEQQKVIDVLYRISSIITARQQQLQKLDELVKARFVEMFGTPFVNEKEWDSKKIGDVVTEVRYGTSKPAVDGGKYPYLRMNNITDDGYLDLNNLKYIDIPDEEIEKCIVRKGDVLFNRTNSTELVGKTAMYDLDEEMVIAGYIIRVRLKPCLLPEVLSQYMNLKPVKMLLHSMAKGAVNQANINAQELQGIEVYVPNIELQHEFVAFKKQLDKSKFVEIIELLNLLIYTITKEVSPW